MYKKCRGMVHVTEYMATQKEPSVLLALKIGEINMHTRTYINCT